jgi:hypothetical protein
MRFHLPPRFRRQGFLALGICLAASACAPIATDGVSRDPNRISYEEIQAVEAANLFEVVQRLRPRWMQDRTGRTTMGQVEVRVYEGDSFLGTLEVLRQFPKAAARSLTYLDSTRAQSLPGGGSGHVAGAIIISRN